MASSLSHFPIWPQGQAESSLPSKQELKVPTQKWARTPIPGSQDCVAPTAGSEAGTRVGVHGPAVLGTVIVAVSLWPRLEVQPTHPCSVLSGVLAEPVGVFADSPE